MKGYCLEFSEEKLKQLFGLSKDVTILKIVNSPTLAHTFMVLIQDKDEWEIAEGACWPLGTTTDWNDHHKKSAQEQESSDKEDKQ